MTPMKQSVEIAPMSCSRAAESTQTLGNDLWEDLRELDEQEKWAERSSVVTRDDHTTYTVHARVGLLLAPLRTSAFLVIPPPPFFHLPFQSQFSLSLSLSLYFICKFFYSLNRHVVCNGSFNSKSTIFLWELF